jgi:hypothetical protein
MEGKTRIMARVASSSFQGISEDIVLADYVIGE